MLEWAKENNIEAEIDEVGNIIMRKPATPGMEYRKGVILQGHLDMVPQKNEDTDHDFEKDPIQAYVDGEWVRAKGTLWGLTTAWELLPVWLCLRRPTFLTVHWKC